MTIETQKLRPDLYFVHAAVLELDGRALALVAPSGYGKSTTAWGLLHHGFKYLSDELAPVHLTAMQVHPFPHALCFKAVPPDEYRIPKETIFTTRTAHVPTQFLPCETTMEIITLEAIFFVRFVGEISEPVLKAMGKGEAAARLFTNALNPLAHSGEGLDGAIGIVSGTRCFELLSSNFTSTCELIKSTFLSLFDKRIRLMFQCFYHARVLIYWRYYVRFRKMMNSPGLSSFHDGQIRWIIRKWPGAALLVCKPGGRKKRRTCGLAATLKAADLTTRLINGDSVRNAPRNPYQV